MEYLLLVKHLFEKCLKVEYLLTVRCYENMFVDNCECACRAGAGHLPFTPFIHSCGFTLYSFPPCFVFWKSLLNGLQQQFPLPTWPPVRFGQWWGGRGWGDARRRRGRGRSVRFAYIPSTPFLLVHCKLVASLYQRAPVPEIQKYSK